MSPEVIYSIVIIFTAMFVFLSFRKKDTEFANRDVFFIVIGGGFIAFGGVIIAMLYGYDAFVDFLLLRKSEVYGKFLLIGYIFIVLGVLFFLEKVWKKLMGSKH